MKHAIMMVSVLVTLALFCAPTVQADEPEVCISLSSGLPGAPVVILDVFASNKAGSRATVYGLSGTASSTQATYPPTEVFYLVSGTAYITTKWAVELSLTGTAEDAACECIKEVVFHVIFDGTNDRYTQIIRSAKDGSTSLISGKAGVAQSCGKKK